MDKKNIVIIAVILVVAILAIVVITNVNLGEKSTEVEYYKGKTSQEFESQLIKTYKDLKKFSKSTGIESVSKNYESVSLLDTYNEEYFQNKKIAVIGIYEDDASVYEYSIDDLSYNEDKTVATITYTNKRSGYEGTLTTNWTNCFVIELEGTVTSVNFNEVTE